MENILEFTIPVIVLGGLIIGYIAKKWINDLDNKYIPTLLAIYGMVANLFITGFTFESIVYGALSGLSATGLHQAFVNLIEKREVM